MMDKEETSDTDSGIILNSGPDSPTLPVKDLTTHTRAMRLKHQALENRLELCLLDLKKLCIREAELTGKLSSDYPLLPDEKPPRVRRRIGATFKLDDSLIHQDGEDSELHSLEAELALQLQIVEAARRLSVEEHLSKPQKKSRLQQCKREDRKVKDLQEAVFQHRIRNECSSPPTNKNNNTAKHRGECCACATAAPIWPHWALQSAGSLGYTESQFLNIVRLPGTLAKQTKQTSSLSDAVALDDDSLSSSSSVDPLIQSSVGSLSLQSSSSQGSLHHTSAQSQSLGSSCRVEQTQTSSMGSSCSVEFPERSPIQNSPWRESNLDQPYLKPNTVCSSRPRSPVETPVGTPVFPADSRVLPSHFPSIKNLALRHGQINSSSAPSTPELHVRRQYSLSFRLPRSKPTHDLGEGRGRARLPRRRPEFLVRSPQYTPQRLYQSSSEHSVPSYTSPQRLYQSSSEDSSSEHSVPSYTSPPSRDTDRDNHKDREGPASPEIPKLCPPPYGFHYGAQTPTSPALNGSSFHKKNNQHRSSPSLRRRMAEEGTCSPLSPQDLGSPLGKGLYLSPSRLPQPQQQHRHWQQGPPPSSPRRVLKPPPPYTRLVHTPSLREYPNQPARVLPREMSSDELKSWNQFQKSRPSSLEGQGSFRVKSPTSPHLPPYLQGPHQKRILQRAADGTPVQWFVEEDSEIVSQV
ncbi:innate immunity activator protein-like [Oncorhynchus tshawytscha]|uniref:innate immunity activator protein-like n=1 Tax=Oncorhynchus tshawytscha TaxID=74940 RepID=UPI001C3C6D25|nr:innate immunity activator protein-like [Oncorhynchus tshawytscha]